MYVLSGVEYLNSNFICHIHAYTQYDIQWSTRKNGGKK